MKRVGLNLIGLVVLILVGNIRPCFAQTIYTWNSSGTTDWTIAANWIPARTTPAVTDILLFNCSGTITLSNVPAQTIARLALSNNTTVNIQAGAAGNILTIAGLNTGDDLTVVAGSALNINGTNAATLFVAAGATANINGNISFSGAAHRLNAADANGIVFNSPAIFTQDVGCTGNAFTNSGMANAVVFNDGTTFIQKAGGNPFALSQPLSKVVFNTGSLFKVQQALFLSFSGRTYANLEIDYPGFNQSATGVNPLTIQDLTITQGTLSLTFTGGVNLQGNIYVASGAALNFNPATAGALDFNGSVVQTITNAGSLTFNNHTSVTFNNAAGIKISNDLTFNDVVHFTAGIVSITSPAILTFGNSASAVNVSNNSFADGLVKKVGNTAFTFPVGKTGTGYVPVKISAPALITDAYTAEYKRSGATALSSNYVAGLDHVSGVDYWVVNRSNGTSPVDITLYWTNESSFNGAAFYINDISKLVIAHYDGSTQWDNFGGTYNAGSGFAAGSVTWNNVSSFSPFSLGSTDITNPLPIKVDYFNGVKQGNKNLLNWKVNCVTSAIITLERSADANNFSGIKKITADAVRCLQPFDCTDDQPLEGINYYRLKTMDGNGEIVYSPTIALLNNKNEFKINGLVPNIISSNAVLHVTAAQNTILEMILTDISGRQIQQYKCSLNAGSNQIELHFSNLAGGVYLLTAIGADRIPQTIRFVKQ